MSLAVQVLAGAAAAVMLVLIIRHHIDYFRRARPYSFGAFLETGGWLILLLVAAGAAAGGLVRPGTRVVEVAAGIVGFLFVAGGAAFR